MIALISALVLFAGLAPATGGAAPFVPEAAFPDPGRFAADIAAFAAADSAAPPPVGAVVCVGSSSMRMWHDHIAGDLAPVTVIPRGFGGSTWFDLLAYAGPLVLKYRPREILVYEGDNDIDFGVTPAGMMAVFTRFVALVHRELPACRIHVLAIKPSPSRWARWPAMREANARVAAACAADPLLDYIDIATPMLDADGQPRRELFLPDMLHMNRDGYAVWTAAIRPVLPGR